MKWSRGQRSDGGRSESSGGLELGGREGGGIVRGEIFIYIIELGDRALQEGRGIMAIPTITLIPNYRTNIEIESHSPQLK